MKKLDGENMYRILLVSPSAETKLLVRKYLKNREIILEEVDDGEKALGLIKEGGGGNLEGPFHLILMEVDLPEMDGFKVCMELRTMERAKEIPLIFLSESKASTSTDKFVAYAIGADDYLVRPWRKEDFWQKVQSKLRPFPL